LIIILSQKIDPENFKKDPKNQVLSIIKTFFEPYAKYIEGKNTSDSNASLDTSFNNVYVHNSIENFVNNFEYDSKIISIINNVYPGLKEIYLIYFATELKQNSLEKIKQESFHELVQFCKDFEIVPYFCSINHVMVYWNLIIKMSPSEITNSKEFPELIESKFDLGQVFNLSKFAAMIIYLSILSYYKYNLTQSNTPNSERLVIFLEKLHNSKGLLNIEKKR